MNILNVNMIIDPQKGGGTAERTVQMSLALINQGYSCKILTLDIGLDKFKKQNERKLTIIPVHCLWERYYLPTFNLRDISNAIKEADIIHLMGHWTILNAISYFYIKKYKKKYVVCPAGALPLFGRSQLLKKIYNQIIGKKIIKNANAHIAIVKDEIAHYETYGVDPKTINLIPNGISPIKLSQYSVRQKLNLANIPFILFIGRLNTIKGPDLLVEAFGLLSDTIPSYHLVLAGPDEGMKENLKKYCSDRKINERVDFLGYVGGEDKFSLYREASLVVIPSRQEAMSIVVLEAGISDVPVVLTDQCGMNELHDLNAAIIVKPEAKSIASGIQKILNDTNVGKEMSHNLKNHIEKNYLWSSVSKKFDSLYKNLINASKTNANNI